MYVNFRQVTIPIFKTANSNTSMILVIFFITNGTLFCKLIVFDIEYGNIFPI